MALLYFVAALAAIVLLAMLVNRVTGTKAAYLETPSSRPTSASCGATPRRFCHAAKPRAGRRHVVSSLRRHTVLWTNRRIVVAQKRFSRPDACSPTS